MPSKQISSTALSFLCLLAAIVGITPVGLAESGYDDSKAAAVAAPIVSGVLIDVHDVPGHETEWAEIARSLIFLREGDRFSPIQLQESIEALKLCKKFRQIEVDSKRENGRISLLFHLTPFRLIKDIRIHGAFPLFERDILSAIMIYTGDAFIQEELPKQEVLIAELFQREGFIAPQVSVTAHEDSKDGYFVIHVRIDKGPYLTLKRLGITGNRAFSDTRLKSKMKIWRVSLLPGSSGRFVERDLKKDMKKLAKFYWRKSYPEAVIDFKVEKDAAANTVSVFLTVDEGARYDVKFVGNEEFWGRTLKKDLVFLEEGNKYDLGLKKSIKKIKERYRMAGYLETRVKIDEKVTTDKDQKIRMLHFVIDEGPRTIVDSIQITGNRAFDEGRINKQMLTRLPGFLEKGVFVPEVLEEDLYAIKSLYLRQGYLNTRVKEEVEWSEDKTKVAITVKIDEGIQTVVASVKIAGITVIAEEQAHGAILLREGEPFRRYMMQSDENALSALISEKGYPHVKVKGDVSISEDKSKAWVTHTVDQGPYVEMGHVYYAGNLRTKEKILRNELELEPGRPFSLVRLLQGQRNVRELDIFESVKFRNIGLKEKKEKVDLFVEVEEEKPYFVELGGGYETDTGFFIHGRTGDRNLFGMNKDAWVGGEWSEIGYRGDLGITEPRLFGSRISATFAAFSERREEFNQDFGTKVYGASIGFNRRWFRRLNTGLSFRSERREQFRRDAEATGEEILREDGDEFEPRSIVVTTPSISYDTRDSFIRPRMGIFSYLSVDISKGLTNSLDDFFKYRFDLRYYLTPLRRLTFAWRGRTGYIDPYGPTGEVPNDQLFFLGGTRDVRGFEENLLRFDADGDPVGGRVAIAGSMEARFDLGHNFELTGFYDLGSVRETIDEAGSDEFRSSVGVGLRYVTPIGPIGFLYGFKLEPEEGESPGRLHFSIGYTF